MTLAQLNTATAAENQLDPQQIALLRSLRNGALLPQLLRTYRDQAARQIEEIRSAVNDADHEAVRVIAHTLKSASFSIGATRLGELCAQLEANARQQALDKSSSLCDELDECFAALLPEITQYLAPQAP
ncbi:MAG: Hpt domain-containing protein [Steroidobacteraceae bacterium]